MNLNSLKISNFGPVIEDQEVDFSQYEEDDIIMVTGENFDDPGMDSNGSGKTYFLNSICWLILGKIPGISDQEEIIKYGRDYCSIEGTFIDNEGSEIWVYRERKRRKNRTKEDIQVKIGGEDHTLRTNSQTQDFLHELWGFNVKGNSQLEDFTNTTYFPLHLVNNITGEDTTSSERFDLIARFLKLDKVDEVKKTLLAVNGSFNQEVERLKNRIPQLKEEIGEGIPPIKEQIKETKKRIKSQEEELEKLEKEIIDLKSDIDIYRELESKQKAKDRLENKIEGQKKRLEELQEHAQTLEDKRESIKAEIEDLEKNAIEPVDATKTEKMESHLSKGRSKKAVLNNDKNLLGAQLDDSLTCPACDTPLLVQEDQAEGHLFLEEFDKEKAEKEYQARLDAIEELSQKITKLEQKILKRKNRDKEYRNYEQKLKDLRKDLENLLDKEGINTGLITNTEEELTDLRKELLVLEEEIRDLHERTEDDSKMDDLEVKEKEVTELKKEIKSDTIHLGSLQETIKVIEGKQERLKTLRADLKEITEDHEDPLFWLENIGEMKRWIIESFLPELEELTNHYLSTIETGFTIRFNTVKEKKSQVGELKQEFHITVIDSSQQERNIESFSAGESKRIAICTGFALRQLTLNSGSNNFNFIMIDEIIDSLDKTGIEEFSHLLGLIPGLKLIISHNDEIKDNFGHLIKISKEDGHSTITQF